MPSVADRVKETTATTGTGTITLAGAAAGYQTFAAAFANATTVYYCIVSGTNWEVGIGTYNSSALSRDTVLQSSSSDAKITLAGTSDVFCTLPEAEITNIQTLTLLGL